MNKSSGASSGTSAAAAASSASTAASATPPEPAWKAQSNSLRQAMAAQREIAKALKEGKDIRSIPVIPSPPDPSFVQCPHCGRRFNQNAAERHIPACANTVNKPKFLRGGTGGSGRGAPQSKPLPRY